LIIISWLKHAAGTNKKRTIAQANYPFLLNHAAGTNKSTIAEERYLKLTVHSPTTAEVNMGLMGFSN